MPLYNGIEVLERIKENEKLQNEIKEQINIQEKKEYLLTRKRIHTKTVSDKMLDNKIRTTLKFLTLTPIFVA